MRSKTDCYRVSLETTNGVGNTARNLETGEYYDVTSGICYVVTDDPAKIYKHFCKKTVLKVEKLGVGYIL